MRTNSRVGTYAYGNAGQAEHAPSTVTPASGPAQVLAYDLNGNMTTGLDGKVMTYDGENRPLTVSFAGRTTAYVYGADGARLKKVETDPVTGTSVTLYMGPVEIRRYGQGAAEEILLYPRPDIRITRTRSGSTVTTKVNALHADGLGSVRAVTDETGAAVERTAYRPYGEEVALAQPLTLPETKGFIGERYDAGAGLQYLNARYYDPKLAMFLQPDWWEVTQEGVGTNRYSYSFDDPVNGKDPSGHQSFGYSRDDFYRDLFGTAETALSGAAEVVVENGAIVADIGLDFTPVVGDIKGIYEAEGGLETAIAVGAAIAGPVGDGLKSGTRVLKAAGIIGPASRRAYQEFKTFEQFKAALGPAGEGRVWHHIVEQCQGKCARAKFPGEMIHNTENVVNIPVEVNKKLADEYASKQSFTGKKTLRDWLNDKPYEEQHRLGKELLEKELERYERDPENYR